MSNIRFARVIPLLRTPLGVDVFDYRLPETPSLNVGDLVVVPFRRQRIAGLVKELTETSTFAVRASSVLHRYGTTSFPMAFIDLLVWTAERTFCSQPTVLRAWLRHLPKRPPPSAQPQEWLQKSQRTVTTHWTATPEHDLLQRAQEMAKEQKRVLILTPWKTRAERWHRIIPQSLLLSSEQNMGDYYSTWERFTHTREGILIATRIGAWLMPFADHVLLDEPENDDYKQDDLSPRYDVRKLAAWMARTQSLSLETFGITPALHVSAAAPTITPTLQTFVRHPGGHTTIPCVQADALFAIESYEGPRVVIHPIRGILAHLTCRDCGWQPTCETCGSPLALETRGSLCRFCHKAKEAPVQCPVCGNVDLGKSFPGIERLKQAWNTHHPDQPIEWRDLRNEDLDTPLPLHAFVLVTIPSLLGGVTEDIRRHERQCVALRRLAARVAEIQGVLGLQGEEEELNRWLSWLSSSGVDAFFQEERAARRLFQYPPTLRRVKILIDQEPKEAEGWQKDVQTHLPPEWRWEGPFLPIYGTLRQRRRHIWHLLVPPEVRESTLIQALLPFAKDVKIDLDPIAFFK